MLISSLLIGALTGCSKAPQSLDLAVTTAPLRIVHPPLPAPVKFAAPNWRECQDEKGSPLVCLTIADAKASVRNKVSVGRWMSSMSAIVHYYRDLDAAPTSTPGK